MEEIAIREQIKRLVALQKIDAEIYELKTVLEEKPALLNQLQQEFEEKKANLKSLEEQLKKLQVDRKNLEVEMQGKEEEIAKANTQLAQLKTNKEYQAKISEINTMKADKSVLEEKILLSYEESEKLQKEIEKEKGYVSEQEQDYLKQKKETEAVIKELEDKKDVLETKRKQALEGIDPAVLSRYERILQNKNGLAVVPVVGNTCGGCYMSLPPQVINELKMHEEIIFCENCARILYLEDDL